MENSMELIIEKMFPDAKIPEKKNKHDSGFDLFNNRFIRLYVSEQEFRQHPQNQSSEFVASSDPEAFSYEFKDGVKELYLKPLDRVMIGTGIKARMQYKNTAMGEFCSMHDVTWELQVRPRSGTALKRGLTITNTPGTVDFGYSGEICLIVTNMSNNLQRISLDERLAQLVPCMVSLPTLKENIILDNDGRGKNGFNSTGTN